MPVHCMYTCSPSESVQQVTKSSVQQRSPLTMWITFTNQTEMDAALVGLGEELFM